MIVVDASVWVSTLIVQDVFHTVSRRWFGQYTSAGGLVVAPVLLLPELAGAIARRHANAQRGKQALLRLERVLGLRLVPHDVGYAQTAARLAADLRLRGADAMYVAIAHAFHIPLVTWDQELLQRASAVIAVQTPQ